MRSGNAPLPPPHRPRRPHRDRRWHEHAGRRRSPTSAHLSLPPQTPIPPRCAASTGRRHPDHSNAPEETRPGWPPQRRRRRPRARSRLTAAPPRPRRPLPTRRPRVPPAGRRTPPPNGPAAQGRENHPGLLPSEGPWRAGRRSRRASSAPAPPQSRRYVHGRTGSALGGREACARPRSHPQSGLRP